MHLFFSWHSTLKAEVSMKWLHNPWSDYTISSLLLLGFWGSPFPLPFISNPSVAALCPWSQLQRMQRIEPLRVWDRHRHSSGRCHQRKLSGRGKIFFPSLLYRVKCILKQKSEELVKSWMLTSEFPATAHGFGPFAPSLILAEIPSFYKVRPKQSNFSALCLTFNCGLTICTSAS